jgi:hypothetical protein
MKLYHSSSLLKGVTVKRSTLVMFSALTLVLSACGISVPPTENPLTEDTDIPTLELTGCTLPALEGSTVYLSASSQDCLFFGLDGCIRYEAK